MSTPLASAQVLVIDCQSTGANPARGSLLEIGWVRTTAKTGGEVAPADVTAHVVALPEGERIPPQVSRITGIAEKDLVRAIDPSRAWRRLAQSARSVARAANAPAALAVIHFARFERPFLLDLHGMREPERPFPLDVVCTHVIAKRMLPDLPRRGLRALAGYLGRSVGMLRRSAEHVAATAFVWNRLVTLLAERHGIRTFDELSAWLDAPAPRSRQARVYPMPRERRLELPDLPGVYRLLRTNGDVLYVGKATSLKKRVNSHFRKQARTRDRTLEMLTQARDLSVTLTESALEAALLEADEIKRCAPPYNKALTSGDRGVFWASRDLASVGERPDDDHVVGPLPSAESVSCLAVLRALLGRVEPGWVDPRERAGALGVSPRFAPDHACFEEGLAIFVDEHPRLVEPRRGVTLRALRDLGTAIWRQRLATKEDRPADEAEADVGADGVEGSTRTGPAWDADRVATALEDGIVRAAHAVRRARWLCRLAESSLVWRDASGPCRALVVTGGEVARGGPAEPGRPAPTPPGYRVPLADRRRGFTLGSFDRLRVLTTELKRIAFETDDVEVRLGPRWALRGGRLRTVLAWV